MATQTSGIDSEIREADDAFELTFGRGDAAGLAELYAEGGMLLPPGADFIKGKKAIKDFWQGAMESGIRAAKLDIAEANRHGDAAIEVGRYKLSDADGGDRPRQVHRHLEE